VSLPNLTVIRREGGLGRRNPSEDYVSGLVLNGVTDPYWPDLELDTTYELLSLQDAEALGITAAYDATNVVSVWYHVSEFFRLNPSGTLFLRLVSQAVSLTQMADKDNHHAASLLADAGGRVRQLGLGRCPASGYTPTITDGIDADVYTAIAKAQELAALQFAEFSPCSIIIEGRAFTGNVPHLANLRLLASDRVSVVLAHDQEGHADADGAAVGTMLGLLSARAVNQDPGWVGPGNIQSVSEGRFLSPKQSGGYTLTKAQGDSAHNKGFIIARSFPGYVGVYFSSGATCTAASSDYAYVNNVRTVDKAIRMLYASTLPNLNGPQLLNNDGTLRATEIAKLEAECRKALNGMGQNNEISALSVWIDPTQNVATTDKVSIRFGITPTGTAREIEFNIGLEVA